MLVIVLRLCGCRRLYCGQLLVKVRRLLLCLRSSLCLLLTHKNCSRSRSSRLPSCGLSLCVIGGH